MVSTGILKIEIAIRGLVTTIIKANLKNKQQQ